MIKTSKIVFLSGVLLASAAVLSWAVERVEAVDDNRDGRPDKWIHTDGKGRVFLKEWDRNHDGKPDLKVFESNGRFTEKHYDDNFDGVFEKIVKAPKKGSTGRTKTSVFKG